MLDTSDRAAAEQVEGPAISQTVRAQLGAPKSRHHLVTSRDIRRFAQAIGEPGDPKGLVAAPLFCQSLAWEELPLERLPPDGSPAELALPLPGARLVGGSSEYVIHRLVRAGDEIEVVTTLKDVRAKRGRNGLLYLLVVETRWTDQEGLPVASELATFVKRP